MKKHNHNDLNIQLKQENNNANVIKFTENQQKYDLDHNNTIFTIKNLISRKKIVGSFQTLNENGFTTVFDNKENTKSLSVQEIKTDYETQLRDEESIYQKYINGITYNLNYYLYFTTKRNRDVFNETNIEDIIQKLKKRINMRYRYIKNIEISSNSVYVELTDTSYKNSYEIFVHIKENLIKILNKDYVFYSGYSSFFTKNFMSWTKPIPRELRSDFDEYTYRRTRNYLNHDLPNGLILDNLNFEVAFFTRRNRNLFKGDIRKDLYTFINDYKINGLKKIDFCLVSSNYIKLSFQLEIKLSPHAFMSKLKKALNKFIREKYEEILGNTALFTNSYIITSKSLDELILENYRIFHKINFTNKFEDS